MKNIFIDQALLRKHVYAELSKMYGSDVPLYDKLLETNREINRKVAQEHPERGIDEKQLDQISSERHGAIRLGKPEELKWMARFFAVMGMLPVNFYNMAEAGSKSQPVLGTAFRPLVNPDQRMFCSLLMPDYFDEETQHRIEAALQKREIFSDNLKSLIESYERHGGITQDQAAAYVQEAKDLFRWRGTAVDYDLYRDLHMKGVNIAADIACFPNPHLNHLTPNSLDIDRLYAEMKRRLGDENYYKNFSHQGMKDSIEGPPPPQSSGEAIVFLRQTAYKALPEEVKFYHRDGSFDRSSTHTARFGEIEQRGVAMTPKGRQLYDAAIKQTEAIDPVLPQRDYDEYVRQYRACFRAIPKTHSELRRQGLAFYLYKVVGKGNQGKTNIDELVEKGGVTFVPIRYEDFLPVSAAGIFAANLAQYGTKSTSQVKRSYTKAMLEHAMGCSIFDSMELYAKQQEDSLQSILR